MRTYAFLIFVTITLALGFGCASQPPQTAQPVAVPDANLAQLMRGIPYPSSNVVFAAQDKTKVEVKQADDPSLATDPLQSAYGEWQAVENAGLALAESASLMTVPGRKCANGRDVPIKNDDWPKLVEGLRQAGLTSYKAAQTKDQDKMLEAADAITTACMNCHDKYREKPNDADRCM